MSSLNFICFIFFIQLSYCISPEKKNRMVSECDYFVKLKWLLFHLSQFSSESAEICSNERFRMNRIVSMKYRFWMHSVLGTFYRIHNWFYSPETILLKFSSSMLNSSSTVKSKERQGIRPNAKLVIAILIIIWKKISNHDRNRVFMIADLFRDPSFLHLYFLGIYM